MKNIQEKLTYEQKISNCIKIAHPMASKKLAKKCYKLIKEAVKHKAYVRRGLKEVQTRIRRGETGLVIFAGDVFPCEMMCHLPAVCEEKNIPYIYTPSRKDLGATLSVKRGCLVVLVKPHEEFKEAWDECRLEINHASVRF